MASMVAHGQHHAGSLRALGHLLKASSKVTVLKAFNRAFMFRENVGEAPLSAIAADFSITEAEAGHLVEALVEVVKTAVYNSRVGEAMSLIDEDYSDIDARLRGLVEQVLTAQLPDWRDASVMSRPALPKLVEVDWRVDVKTASDQVLRMNVPSVLEALSTMLDGLGKIRDQLSGVAGAAQS
mmetsp:Transcript_108569/g.315791  ORF Transcript_108569/g.315791 Transcript_108569/m.315791 type:complete len:182 (+) Transcript_108569:85-630(+)